LRAGKFASSADAADLDDTTHVGEEEAEKVDEQPPEAASAEPEKSEGQGQPQPQQGRGKKKQQYKKEEPFIFLDSDDIYNTIKYAITQLFGTLVSVVGP
jgi:hypothetical protein